jgi:hypothetical protein
MLYRVYLTMCGIRPHNFTGSFISNYHTIKTTVAPQFYKNHFYCEEDTVNLLYNLLIYSGKNTSISQHDRKSN